MEWVKFTTLMITFLLRSSSVPRLTARLLPRTPSPHPPTTSSSFRNPVYSCRSTDPSLEIPLSPSLSSPVPPGRRSNQTRLAHPFLLAFVNITNLSGCNGSRHASRNGSAEEDLLRNCRLGGSFYRDTPWNPRFKADSRRAFAADQHQSVSPTHLRSIISLALRI